jgi:hypothetical protein
MLTDGRVINPVRCVVPRDDGSAEDHLVFHGRIDHGGLVRIERGIPLVPDRLLVVGVGLVSGRKVRVAFGKRLYG